MTTSDLVGIGRRGAPAPTVDDELAQFEAEERGRLGLAPRRQWTIQ